MHQAYSKRLDALEARTGDTVYGIQCVNAAWHSDPAIQAGLVKISGRDDVMTLEEFERRYRSGQLIRVVYDKNWRGEDVR